MTMSVRFGLGWKMESQRQMHGAIEYKSSGDEE